MTPDLHDPNKRVILKSDTHSQEDTTMTAIEKTRLDELETVVELGLQTFYDVGMALVEIRDERLYRQDYSTWEAYCRDRWGFNRARANNLISAFKIVNVLDSSESKVLPSNESQVRPLKLLEPEQQVVAWQRVIETAPDGDPNKVTGAHVQRIVDDMRGVERDSDTGRLLAPEPDYNYKRDNKSNRLADEYVPQGYDACQTPPYAVAPLWEWLAPNWILWEPAAGEGLLVDFFRDGNFEVEASDILTGENFFEYAPRHWDCIVTNPPFSLKYKWLARCYELDKPFALLLPVETIGAKTAQEMFRKYGLEIIFMDKRVDFKMPNKGWDGGGAQFPVAWFTWGLSIGRQMTFARLDKHGKIN